MNKTASILVLEILEELRPQFRDQLYLAKSEIDPVRFPAPPKVEPVVSELEQLKRKLAALETQLAAAPAPATVPAT